MGTVVYLIALIVLLIMTPSRFEPFNANYNLGLSIVYFVLVMFHLYRQTKFTKNWLRFDVLFIIGYTIVHIQIPYFASIGIEPSDPNFVWINRNVVNFATWMSVMAILFWILGYNFTSKKNIRLPQITRKTFHTINYFKYDLLLLISFLLFISLVGSGVLGGSYNGVSAWGEGANYAYLILTSLLYLRIIYFFKEIPKKSNVRYILNKVLSQKMFSTILIIYVILFLFSGDRGPVLAVALIVAGLYALYIKPIPLNQLVLFVVLGAFIFSIISLGRGGDAEQLSDGNIFERGYASYQTQESGNTTEELATSVRLLYVALDVVPNKHSYLYGITFFTVGVGVVPFLSSTVIDVFKIPKMYKSSSSFFTILTKGPNPTSGAGSELLGDIYINFGLIITFFIMLLFGMFSGHVFNQIRILNFNYVLIFIILLYSALSMNRGMLFTPLKDIVYISFFNYLFTRIIK